MAAYLVGGVYVLPWYSAWALPASALTRRSFLGVLVATHGAFLVAVYELELPAHISLTGVGAVIRTTVIVICSSGFLAAFVIALLRAPATEDQPRTPGFPLRP
jgi:hypothetical protein